VAAVASLGNGAAEPSVDQLLGSIQKRYEAVKDIRASFEQEARVASIGKTEKSSGEVAIQRPGRMRWQYSAPDRRIVALDGEVIRMYLPDEGQLQIAPLQPGAFPPTALEFLLGSGDLAKSFTAEPLREEGREDLGLRLKPKQDASFEAHRPLGGARRLPAARVRRRRSVRQPHVGALPRREGECRHRCEDLPGRGPRGHRDDRPAHGSLR
jgi:outer membrane lipoprotein-sorting protein